MVSAARQADYAGHSARGSDGKLKVAASFSSSKIAGGENDNEDERTRLRAESTNTIWVGKCSSHDSCATS